MTAQTGLTTTSQTNLAGVLCVTVAASAYTLNDVCIKWLSDTYPLHELTFFRSLVALIITLALFVPIEGSLSVLRTRRPFWHVFRGLMTVLGNMAFFVGMATLPLSEATSIYFVAPLFVTAFSVLFLGEHVGWRRWLAVGVGFAGVMLIIRPGAASFQYAALLPLISAAGNAVIHISTRKLSLTERASTMTFYIHLVFLIFSAGFGLVFGAGQMADGSNANLEFLFRGWVWPNFTDFTIMAVGGMFSAFGTFLICQGYRLAQAGVAAPFEYIGVPLAVVWSILFWGHWPEWFELLGIPLIVGAGLYVVMREYFQGYAVRWKKPWRGDG